MISYNLPSLYSVQVVLNNVFVDNFAAAPECDEALVVQVAEQDELGDAPEAKTIGVKEQADVIL